MFTANSRSGRTVSLLNDVDRTYINAQTEWYCPVCQEPLRLKKGRKRRTHFAHRANTACSSNGESDYHLEGKALLYQWLKGQGLHVHVEAFLPETKQRADLLAKEKDQSFALEYQCTAISRDAIRERTEMYRSIGIQPLWVRPFEHVRRKGTVISLKEWEWEAAFQDESSLTLMAMPRLFYLQPPSFLWIAHLNAYLSPHKANARFVPHRLTRTTLEHVRVHAISTDMSQRQALLSYKKNSRYGKRPRLTSFSALVQELLLRKNMPIQLHPAETGWFLPVQTWVSEPPLLWQSWLLLKIMDHFENRTCLTVNMFEPNGRLFSDYLQLPFKRVHVVIESYLWLLVRFRVLRRHVDGTFTLVQTPYFPRSVDEGFAMDQRYAAIVCALNDSVAPDGSFPL